MPPRKKTPSAVYPDYKDPYRATSIGKPEPKARNKNVDYSKLGKDPLEVQQLINGEQKKNASIRTMFGIIRQDQGDLPNMKKGLRRRN